MNHCFRTRFIAAFCVIFISGCNQELDSHSHPELTSGKQLFEHHCISCHGNAGEGDFLSGIPASRNTTMDKDQLIVWLKNAAGEPRAAPSFTAMSDSEADKIVTYLLTLKQL